MTSREEDQARYALSIANYQRERESKLKKYNFRLFGNNNIMFDSEITAGDTNSWNQTKYTYTMKCKLCNTVTKRSVKTNLYLCSGCYREWDPKTNEIMMPSNDDRVRRTLKNGLLVLPHDEPDVAEVESDGEEVSMKVVTLKPGQSFYCKELNMLFVGASE